jgi:RecA-family ATPase
VSESSTKCDAIITLDELLKTPADNTFYLSWPLIPRGGRIIIGAPAKHYKSMLALNLAYDLAEGIPLCGLKKRDGSPLWPVKRPYVVLYVEKEIGKYRLKERMEKIHSALDGEIALDNLYLDPKGNQVLLDVPSGITALEKRLDKINPDVLILDPLRKFHVQDEDSSTEMVRVMSHLDAIQQKYHDLTTIVLHHTGKRSEFRDQRKPEALRGSSLMFDDADTVIMMSRENPNKPENIQLNFVLRSAEDPKPVNLVFDKETFLFKPRKEQ